jgi:SAM-dependent methyltransferase
VGRWSRRVAIDFLEWLDMPPALAWLDVGCGTGALAETIVERARAGQVFGVEPSDGFLAVARARIGDKVNLLQGSAAQIPLADEAVDVVVSGLVLNFIPDLAQALAEMKRVAKPQGTIAAYVWDYAQGMELMRHFWDVATSLDPEAHALDEGTCFSVCRPTALAVNFEQAGLADVEVGALTIETAFRDFDDYWTPFLGGQGPAPAYACSLDEASREALREQLVGRLPANADGSIVLNAKAWAVRGRKAA